MQNNTNLILLRGGGDLASGVAVRLCRAGLRVVITEIAQPLAVRRTVSFAEAVYAGAHMVEGLTARRADDAAHAHSILQTGEIPVLVDSRAQIRFDSRFTFRVYVDARMTKRPPDLGLDTAPLVIGLGPGFVPGENCHAAIETMRGHTLGRALWDAPPAPNTGIPGKVGSRAADRVLRAPADGVLRVFADIGAQVQGGQVVAEVEGARQHPIRAPFDGLVRGMLHSGLPVRTRLKIGDLDPRNDPAFIHLVSDKALSIGGGTLEAILTRPEIRGTLWGS